MPPPDDAPTAGPEDARDRRRHELLTPLTVIRGRAFLLARAVRRSPTLGDEERERLLAGLAAIEEAVDRAAAAAVAGDAPRRPPGPEAAGPEPARCG